MRRWVVLGIGASVATLTSLAVTPLARADAELSSCVERASAALTEQGAVRREEPAFAFLREGQSHTFPFTLDRAECVGFFAVGHRRVLDIDLALLTEDGVVLQQDTNMDAHPYVRFCGAAGLRVFVTAQMYKGQGELAVVSFSNAPPVLPDLNRTVGDCFATSGGMRRPAGNVGPAPPGRTLADATSALGTALSTLGYRESGTEQRGELQEAERETRAVRFEARGCYAVAVLGSESVVDVDLFLRQSDGREVARDVSREPGALVKVCTEGAAELVAEVRMYDGQGAYELRTFSLDAPVGELPNGVGGNARAAWAEITARLAGVSTTPRPVAWGMLVPGESLSIPITLAGGRCHVVTALTADEAAGGDLDLLLLDEDDHLVAWDLGRDAQPFVYHCATVDERLRAVGRMYGAWGRYLLILGEESDVVR